MAGRGAAQCAPGCRTIHAPVRVCTYHTAFLYVDNYTILYYTCTHITHRIYRCAGVDALPKPRPRDHRPHVVLLNRRYHAGRGLLRLDEVAWRLQDTLDVEITFLEGLRFQGICLFVVDNTTAWVVLYTNA